MGTVASSLSRFDVSWLRPLASARSFSSLNAVVSEGQPAEDGAPVADWSRLINVLVPRLGLYLKLVLREAPAAVIQRSSRYFFRLVTDNTLFSLGQISVPLERDDDKLFHHCCSK